MKRRRILALLLALSISMSMNGLTVLAASPDPAVIPATAAEDEPAGDEKEDSAGGQKAGTSGESTKDAGNHGETAEEQSDSDPSDVSNPEETDSDQPEEKEPGEEDTKQPDEVTLEEGNGDQSGEVSPEEGDGDQSGEMPPEEGNGDQAGEGSPEEGDGDQSGEVPPEEGDDEQPPEDETDEGDSDGEENPDESDIDVSVSDNTLGADSEDQKDESEELTGKAEQTVKMMTFTDDTGMRITYNANEEYNLIVTDGVLEGIVYEDGSAVKGVVVIPEGKGITAIGTAFKGNEKITYVKLPRGVISVQDNAFNNCYNLQGIYLPGELQTIGNSAFYRCTGLLKVAVPKRVTSIGNAAFYGSDKLFMIYMQEAADSGLVSIGDEAFYQCRALEYFCSDKGFVIPGNLEAIGASAFYDCRAIKEIEFRESIQTLGEGAFQYCNMLKSVILSGSIKVIPKNAFAGCNKLVNLEFKRGNETIGEAAFEGCMQLGGLLIPGTVRTISSYAFKGCTGLVRVEVLNSEVVYGDSVFPNQSSLTLIGSEDSSTERYTIGKNIKFVKNNADPDTVFYKYNISYLGDGSGTLVIKDADGQDPNTLNKKQGVKARTKLYVYVKANEGSKLVQNSIKCNGVPVLEETGAEGTASRLYFEMPIGGARITAEFENTASSNKTSGQEKDVKVEISNGEVRTDDQGDVIQVKLKAGQYSRMFLTDKQEDNKAIPSSKITYKSSNTAVATIKNDGTIHALKKGYTEITARVMGGDDNVFTKSVRVDVVTSGVEKLKLTPERYDVSAVQIVTSSAGELQTAVIDKKKWNGKELQFELRATAYDADDESVSVALKWSSSDAKVAKLASTATTVGNPVNIVSIPQDTSGEATIRVTATNADKKTITQKFVVRVIDQTPRLVSNKLTVNPNHADGTVLQIVSAYGRQIDKDRVRLVKYDEDGNKVTSREFDYTYSAGESNDTVASFRLTTPYQDMENKDYKLFVEINGGEEYPLLPLTVTVKTSKPKAKIAFQKKQPKKNIFYADDGTEFVVNVSNLGKAEVSDFELQPLDKDNADDRKFQENFDVEYVDKATCIIRQQVDQLKSAEKGKNKGKPVVCGYLRLYFEGYREEIYQDIKITLPTERKAPSFKLSRTTDTFRTRGESQEIELQLLDKKKNPADLSDGGYELSVFREDEDGRPLIEEDQFNVDDEGRFVMTLQEGLSKGGKVRLRLENKSLWATGEKVDLTYTVKLSKATPVISLSEGPASAVSLKNSTVTINPNYPEQTVEFGLKANQKGVVIADDQEFKEKSTKKTQAEYAKLKVEYTGGVGSVTVEGEDIKDGTYTYVCDKARYIFMDNEEAANKVTLKVKIKKGVPSVTVKGSISLNNEAQTEDNSFVEKSEVTLTTKNLPEGYEFDAGSTTFECTTKDKEGYEERFDWELVDRQVGEDGKVTEAKLIVSLNEYCKNGTYKFRMTPVFSGSGGQLEAKKVTVTVKIHDGEPNVTLSAKGKLNLLDRESTQTATNSIVYTPSLKNIKDKVIDAKVYDYGGGRLPNYDDMESEDFEAHVLTDGKVYVRPKEDAELKNNTTYKVFIWVELENYKFREYVGGGGGLMIEKPFSIKTAQILPKVTTDKSTVNLYLSNKEYVATFVVEKKDAKAIGNVESIAFGEKDTNAQESFVTTMDENTGKNTVIESEQLSDGSLEVKLKLRDTVHYGCNTTNKLTMYVRFEGQGTNTPGTAITMNVKINK